MTDVVVASTEADASAATAIEQHHAELSGALTARVEALVGAAARGDAVAADTARAELARWCAAELVPHAQAEERTLYPAARGLDTGRLLIDGMLGEHTVIVGLVGELGRPSDPVRAAVAAGALQAVFGDHLRKENELVLPLLTQAPGISLAGLLEGMHEELGGAEESAAGEGCGGGCGCGGHADAPGPAGAPGHAGPPPSAAHGHGGSSCGCGETDPAGFPELDARAVPHAIRHATIFGALGSVAPGAGLILVAPHDPLPLLAQIGQRWPGVFDVHYLERGPEAWRLAFARA